MTLPAVPRLRIDAPSAPIPQRFGLFSASTVIDNADPHSLTGVEYEVVCSTQVDPYPAACLPLPPDVSRVKQAVPTTGVGFGTPFGVYAADDCALGRDPDTARRQLRQRFLAGEQTQVERIVRTGLLGNYPNLELEAVPIGPGTALPVPTAIGLLEQWLSVNYGGVGVIHAPRTVAPYLGTMPELTIQDGQAVTIFGSVWAFGTGYTGDPPDHPAADDENTVWLYATPPVTVRRSRLIEPAGWDSGAFDIAQNIGFLLDERLYVVDWPCGTAAVKTTLPRVYATPTPVPPAPPQPEPPAGGTGDPARSATA
ncbi:hypothetical protein [Saccharothrix sp. HUAS TT1]|uniref:hypothetical protein n=1 Tax=unclassified Saccharothrix TaxID=2593673 RepID=UPI00345BAA9E